MEKNKRSTQLTILCLLTFVFSSIQIFNGIVSYGSPETVISIFRDKVEEVKESIAVQEDKNSTIATQMIATASEGMSAESVKSNAVASIFASIFTLIGAILMWGLNKKGFSFYLIGTAIMIIAPMIIYHGSPLGIIGTIGQALIGILFCFLYHRCFKNIR